MRNGSGAWPERCRRGRLRAAAVVVLIGACAGCHPATTARAGHPATVDTTASGTIVVHNPRTGVWDSTDAWRVVVEHRIGRALASGPDAFGRIMALAAGPAGRVYVFDGQAHHLLVFDSSGAYVRTVGRWGHGPGEFTQVSGMAWGPHDRLWIVDPNSNRVTVMDTAGQVVAEHLMVALYVLPWPGAIDAAGHVYTDVPGPPGDPVDFSMVELDTTMAPLDTVALPRSKAEYFEARTGGGVARVTIPFTPAVEWKIGKDGDVWFTDGGEYRIYRRSLDGRDTLEEIERAYEPVPVTSRDVDRAIEGLRWFTRQGGRIDRSRIPGVKPPIRGFLLDDAGDLWVEPSVADSARNGRVLDVFDPRGRYLGRLELPFRPAGSPVVRGDHFYSVVVDHLGVQYVVIARIEKP